MNATQGVAASRTDGHAWQRGHAENGLTLIELLVVVFLLGLLAQAAVLASAGALEEAQQQTTQQTLAQLEIALLGQPQRLDSLGRPNFGGFVADVGGLPVHRGAPASATPEEAAAVALRELWMQPGADPATPDQDGLRSVAGFALQTTVLDADVRLACGWRGPYLRLGVGVAALRDGWGNAYLPFDRTGVASALGGEIAAVLSYGADAQAAGTGYAADLSLLLDASSTVLSPMPVAARQSGDVTVRVQTLPSGGDVLVVRLYGPVTGPVAGTLGLIRKAERSPTGISFTPGDPVVVTLAGVPIGPRVLRAYQTTAVPLDTDPVPAGPRSPVLPITVEPYAIQPLQLTIQGS